MEEDTEYQKLPVEDRVVHKLWKARVHGYEELTKLFRQIDDEKSPEFAKYLGLVKKFVVDSNVMGQEKGLETTLAYVENYANADRTVGEVMAGIVAKCIAAPKAKTRELAVQIVLMYIEIEKHEVVQEELMKGMDIKNPKTVAACINTTTLALREFGPKVVNVKKLIKKMHTLLADRDKNVRDETKAMVIEIYRWIGAALKTQLTNLQPVQITELEAEFTKVESGKAEPTRYLRSQQQRQAKMAAQATEADEGDGGEDDDSAQLDIDPYELIDPVNILAKLPNDFYEKVEAKKWQERKEAMEALEELVKNPKLENGDYGDVVRALKKVISKDTNVMVVAIAGKCLAGLANGLKKRFQPYAGACVPALLEKFKEKKQNVVQSLREALDAIFPSTTIEAIMEDVLEALNNKNPSVKAETASFLTRTFSKCQPTALNKKILKAYTTALLKTLNESDPTVRDNSAEALGTLMKLVGEKAITPFLADVENLKMQKIKECCEKAVITVKIIQPKKERPTTAPVKPANEPAPKAGSTAPKPVKRPSSAAPKKKPNTTAAPPPKGGKTKPSKPTEIEMSPEEIEERASEFLPSDILPSLADSNWKTRLQAVETYQNEIKKIDPGSISSQILIGVLNRKPGFKDTNVQVLKLKFETLKNIIEIHGITNVSANGIMNEVTDKLGDAKTSNLAAEILSAIAECIKLDYVVTTVLDYAFTQKNPKVQQEALLYVSTALKEFGLCVNSKSLVEFARKGVSATQPAIRAAGITLLGTMYLYMGTALHAVFDNEKPALKQQITAEFDRCYGEKPPEPTRGISKSRSASTNDLDEIEEDSEEVEQPIQDLIPRVDISGQITEALINEMGDKNWKVRNEALTKVMNILNEARSIHTNVGDLPQALFHRLTDSNGKIAQTALQICQQLATAMGPQCKQHIRVLFPGFLSGLSDNKNWMRNASITCMNTWGDTCGYKEFFEGEMIGDALKTGSPNLRCELWAWLADKLGKVPVKSIPKEELIVCLPILYQNLEDRSAEVRKNVQEAVLPFMLHLGYESMVKQTEKLKPGSKPIVMEALEKVRPLVPVKPLPKAKQPAGDKRKSAAPSSAKPGVAKPGSAKTRQSIAVGGKAPVARKKEEDIDLSPLLVMNNLKHQRVIDEQKLKVLKWNFTQPREEFVELLRDQMTAAKVNKTLISNMFHADFRYHLKAIESLVEDLPDNGQALVSNLDLILKWLSLRFFDTNPSVLLKGLEYLQLVFNMLIENNVRLLENEASSFIPYLILKVGDPKDAVRNGVRALFGQISRVYPVGKFFNYIIEGLKSKNARQRTECLEELGNLIGNHGISICQPSPSAALKEVAKQISDRDNSVRNAALNCIVQAFHHEGEKIYKMIGQISDKDLSLLEERIKRAAKKSTSSQRLNTNRNSMMLPVNQSSPSPGDTSPVLSREPSDLDKEDVEPVQEVSPPPPVSDTTITVKSPSPNYKNKNFIKNNVLDETVVKGKENIENVAEPIQQPASPVQGPFFLDPEVLKEIEGSPVVIRRGPPPVDWESIMRMLDEPIKYPDNYSGWFNSKSPQFVINNRNQYQLGPKEVMASTTFHIPGPSITSLPIMRPASAERPRSDHLLENTCTQIASTDLQVAHRAIIEVDTLLNTGKANSLLEYEDVFIKSITTQLQLLYTYNPQQDPFILKSYRAILTVIAGFYDSSILGKNISKDTIKNILEQLITLLSSGKFENIENKDSYIKVINTQCLNIIEYSDHTKVICALITLLNECVAAKRQTRHLDLVMKCLWRLIKSIPDWSDDIDCDTILYDIHIFFKDYPSAFWKQQPSDYPIRTVKTVLHSMAKIKGKNLMSNLSKIQNGNESELQTYLLKLLKTLKLEEVKQIPLKKDPKRQHLSKSVNKMLADIFGKIGEKETTKEGLTMLYDFRLQHPETDIEPYLSKSSKYFQEYIEKGLKEIEMSRNNKETASNPLRVQVDIGNNQEYVSSQSNSTHHKTIKEPLQWAKNFGIKLEEPPDRQYPCEEIKNIMLDMRKQLHEILQPKTNES